MSKYLTLFLLWVSSSSFEQRYKTVDIIKTADSLIISIVGKDIFKEHYQLDTTSEIDPVQQAIDKEQKIKHISLASKYSRHFNFISADFIFYLKRNEDPSIPTSLIFDKNLHLKYPIDTSFIPKFILQKTVDNFISKEQALKIAKSKFNKQGLKIESRIYYDPNRNDYVWEITNVLEESIESRIVEFIKSTL
jgi:hypothetical protein